LIGPASLREASPDALPRKGRGARDCLRDRRLGGDATPPSPELSRDLPRRPVPIPANIDQNGFYGGWFPAIAGGDEQAVAAKKKCKKGKKSAVTAKKKKCKRGQQVVLAAPAPLVRATLSWSAFNEVDLHA